MRSPGATASMTAFKKSVRHTETLPPPLGAVPAVRSVRVRCDFSSLAGKGHADALKARADAVQ